MNSHEPTLEILNEEARYSNKSVSRLKLISYRTGGEIRSATVNEWKECIKQSLVDGGIGVITIDNKPCYVEDCPDKIIFESGEDYYWLMQWANANQVRLIWEQGELDGEQIVFLS